MKSPIHKVISDVLRKASHPMLPEEGSTDE